MDKYQQFPCSEGLRLASTGATICRPHFHAFYSGLEVIVSIEELEVLDGKMASKQLKMLLGWVAFHQEELRENWELAKNKQDLFAIEPLK